MLSIRADYTGMADNSTIIKGASIAFRFVSVSPTLAGEKGPDRGRIELIFGMKLDGAVLAVLRLALAQAGTGIGQGALCRTDAPRISALQSYMGRSHIIFPTGESPSRHGVALPLGASSCLRQKIGARVSYALRAPCRAGDFEFIEAQQITHINHIFRRFTWLYWSAKLPPISPLLP